MKHLLKNPNIYTETHCGQDITTTNTQLGTAEDADCTTCLVREAARLDGRSKLIAKRLAELRSR